MFPKSIISFHLHLRAMYTRLESVNLFRKYVKIAIVVAIYWFTSIVTVFVNKSLLSSDTVNLDAPLFVTWFQCVISATICFVLSQASRLFPGIICVPKGNPVDINTFKKVLPLSILFTCMIATNNLCLKHVAVAFYYVGRSLTTVFNVLFSYLLLRQTTSFRCILCCTLIISGFWLGVDQESITGSFSLIGTIYGVIGSLSLSLYSIYTKKTLPYVHDEVWLLGYYNNVYSCFLFIPLIIFTGEIKSILNYPHLFELWFIVALSIGGVCGFAVGYATALQIQVTSPLTHNISGTAKACAQTVIATQWFNETKSFLWWLSNVIVLTGSGLYARVKQLEMERKHHQDVLSQKV